jgi:hypothetical protein
MGKQRRREFGEPFVRLASDEAGSVGMVQCCAALALIRVSS